MWCCQQKIMPLLFYCKNALSKTPSAPPALQLDGKNQPALQFDCPDFNIPDSTSFPYSPIWCSFLLGLWF
jgi:hypothetical protein